MKPKYLIIMAQLVLNSRMEITAVIPNIFLECPSANEGKRNHRLQYSVDTYEVSQNPSIKICRNKILHFCPTNGYTTSDQTVGSNITAQLNISSVMRKDEGTWTCFISFTVSSGTHHMNKSCNLMVYSISHIPVCQHTFNATTVLVTCSTYKVYPEARCKWHATFGINRIKVAPESVQHKKYILDKTVYYNTTCTASFRPDVKGVFKIEIAMIPNYNNQLTQGVTQDYNITIDLDNYDIVRAESDTTSFYFIIPPCLVVLIVIAASVSVRKGSRSYGRTRQNKTRSNLDTKSLHLPLDEDGYLLVLGASVGSPHIEHTYSNAQPFVGSDVEHESFGNVSVDNMRNREHVLEGSNSENPYNVIQETEETMDQVGSNEVTHPSTVQEKDQTPSLGNLSGPLRLSDLTNVYDRLDENSYNDYLDVYNVPDSVPDTEHADIL